MNALVIIDPHARARAIRAKFFPPIKPVNWLKAKPAPVDVPPATRVIMRAPGADYDEHVLEWRLWRAQSTTMPFHRIIKKLARAHGLSVDDITGPSRMKHIIPARQEAMYRAAVELGMSYNQIGMSLGGRDHSTIIHGVKAHAKRNGLPIPERLV